MNFEELQEIQSNEIEALKAIFMDDFKEVVNKSAWKVAHTDPEFILRLSPLGVEESDAHVSVDLKVRFPRSYPNKLPELHLIAPKGLTSSVLQQLNLSLHKTAQELLGQEMMYDLSDFVRAFLANHNIPPPPTSKLTLHEQMMIRNEQDLMIERRREVEEESRRQKELEAELRVQSAKMNEQIQQDIERKREHARAALEQRQQKLGFADTEDDMHLEFQEMDNTGNRLITFENITEVAVASNDNLINVCFRSVALTSLVGGDTIGEIYMAQPINYKLEGEPFNIEKMDGQPLPALLAIKKVDISGSYYTTLAGKRKLQDVEKELDRLRKVRHPHVLSVYDARLDRNEMDRNCWTLYIMMGYEQGGTLHDLLFKCGGGLRLSIIRKYMNQLLWALNDIHLNSFICREIRSDSIYCTNNQSVKLAHISYNKRLYDLNKSNPLLETSSDISNELPPLWLPPEIKERPGLYNRKSDIWYIGIVFLEMLWGVGVVNDYENFDSFLAASSQDIPEVAISFAKKILDTDPKKRLTAIELMNDPFLSGEPDSAQPGQRSTESNPKFVPKQNVNQNRTEGRPLYHRTSSEKTVSPHNDAMSQRLFGTSHYPSTRNVATVSTDLVSSNVKESRYRTDFEEIEFLGKGGFGEVVKARNRLDGRLYAVKKIRLDPKDSEDLKKILREVHSLSSLHHQYVVRYFATWFEDEDGSSLRGNSGSDSEEYSDEDDMGSDYDEEDADVSAYKQFDDFLSTDKHGSKSKSKSYSNIYFNDDNTSTSSDSDKDNEFDGDAEKYDADFISFGAYSNDKTSPSDDTISTEKYAVSYAKQQRNKKKSSEKSSDFSKPQHRTRVLYIQMEYCEKKTLRDVIDEGIEEQEAWRLFRHILEGLVHIHSQGMIHRDLKPANIFLDSNNDVKIGDFGLATSSQTLVENSQSYSRTASQVRICNNAEVVPASASYAGYSASNHNLDESMTTGVGTTFYVSPEVMPNQSGATVGMRYNQKVDMFSLGIIFFEMCYQFSTGMQRVIVLNELRNGTFPSDFPNNYVHQKKIISILLSPQPKDRPNSFELLRSDLLPPKLEDEYIKECVRTIANPNTPYYDKLMSAMFSQSPDRLKDLTYDYQSSMEIPFDPFSHLFLDRIREHMAKTFRRHGAIEVSAPLLIPKNDLYEWNWKTPVYLMDSRGSLNQLPYDQTVPFARCVARQKGFSELKRFTFDKVYRENQSGGQPEAVFEADFDIVHKETAAFMVPDAEVLKVVEEVLEELPPYKNGNFYFMINHTNIADLILDSCRVPPDIRKGVLVALSSLGRVPSFAAVRNVLKLKFHVQKSVLDELSLFNIQGELETVSRKVENLLTGNHKIVFRENVSALRTLIVVSKHIGIHHKIIFHPLLVYNNHFYKGGLIFETISDTIDSKRKDVLAVGGRYDFLIQHFAHPNAAVNRQLRAVGVNIAVQKLVRHLDLHQSEQIKHLMKVKDEKMRSFGAWAPKTCDVYVASFGKVLLQERMDLVNELWSHGIRAQFQYYDDDQDGLSPEDLISLCKKACINWIVIVKHKNSENNKAEMTVKVKDVLRKTETEIGKSDLCQWLTSEINEQSRIDSVVKVRSKHELKSKDNSDSARNDHFSLEMNKPENMEQKKTAFEVNLVFSEGRGKERTKTKHKHKTVITDKAINRLSPIIDEQKKSVQVIASDLPKDTIQNVIGFTLWQDDEYKKLLDEVGVSHHDTLHKVRQSILKLIEAKHKCVWLYSHKDDFALLYCLS
ncbi:kinase-like domain-containing protein [Sporodiniella umbellata]|nr:kinase-like domain-containing protein [Sporodiniella umbellata]